VLARNPIAQFNLTGRHIDPDATDQGSISRTCDEKARKPGINRQLHKTACIILAVWPWRTRKVPHHAFIGDPGIDGLPILWPSRSQEQPFGAVEHLPSPQCPAAARLGAMRDTFIAAKWISPV
jgi:hypothetical protein